MKSYRQQLVSELVEQEAITSQEQLRERLRGKGIEVTQATLSRDIRDLGLVKRAGDGAYRRPGAEAPASGREPDGASARGRRVPPARARLFISSSCCEPIPVRRRRWP